MFMHKISTKSAPPQRSIHASKDVILIRLILTVNLEYQKEDHFSAITFEQEKFLETMSLFTIKIKSELLALNNETKCFQ